MRNTNYQSVSAKPPKSFPTKEAPSASVFVRINSTRYEFLMRNPMFMNQSLGVFIKIECGSAKINKSAPYKYHVRKSRPFDLAMIAGSKPIIAAIKSDSMIKSVM